MAPPVHSPIVYSGLALIGSRPFSMSGQRGWKTDEESEGLPRVPSRIEVLPQPGGRATALPSFTAFRSVVHCLGAMARGCTPALPFRLADLRDGVAMVVAFSLEVLTMSRKHEKTRIDIYARITEKIVADLERGVRPWMRPWCIANAADRVTRPLRYNGLPYSGMNVLLLWSEAMARGFASPTWMTFKQALELGGAVRKGETGSMVVFASRFTKTDVGPAGEEFDREIPFLKAYTVFNVAQIDGLPDRYYGVDKTVADPVERIEHADRFFANTGAVIRHGGVQAYYSPASDHIQMPPFQTFRDAASYVAVLSHEATHWTAAPNRVGRDLSRYAKDKSERAREELIAELGSCFLCADLGIVPELEPRPDHASYLDSWLRSARRREAALPSRAGEWRMFHASLHHLRRCDWIVARRPCQKQLEEPGGLML